MVAKPPERGIAFAAGIITAAALGDRAVGASSSPSAWPCSPSRPPPGIGPERVGADRRPHGAGTRRRDRAAAEPHDLDDRVPGRTARDDRGHLWRARRAGRCRRAAGRRGGHPGHQLALDLLDQRTRRGSRRCGVAPAAAGELRGPRAARPGRSRAGYRRGRGDRLGASPRRPGRVGQPGDRDHAQRRRRPAGRLRRLGESRVPADGPAAAVRPPRVRDRQRHHVLHVGRDLRGRLPRRRRIPVRAPLLTGVNRPAAAAVLRHADGYLAARRGPVRQDLPPAGDGHRARPAHRRLYLGRGQGHAGDQLGRAHARPARFGHRYLDGAAHRAHRRARAVAPHEMGKASGINYMAQRLGGVFAIAISTLCSPPPGPRHAGQRHQRVQAALAACAGLALAATLSAIAIPSRAAAVTRTGRMTAGTRVSSST